MRKPWPLACALVLSACGGDEGIQNPPRDEYGEWEMVEPPGAVCGNGSQYRFFVNYSDTSDNLAIVFEPGGACWDYDSCTGRNGIRGAANPNGIPEDHFYLGTAISPFLNRGDPDSPTRDWNMVYVPYCTGDVHTGNNVIEYVDESEAGDPPIMFHHAGHEDTQKVIEWIDDNFTHVPKMLVTGCSAGGAGSITNYWFIRNGVSAAEQAYMLDDSGPIFPSTGFSGPLHAKIRSSWNVDSILEELPSQFDPDDYGTLNEALANAFPDDRLATTYFRRDMNFSLYSYERFYEPTPDKEGILDMWDADTSLLVDMYDRKDNLYYYLPYWRAVNDSHCTTLFSFPGSEIQDHQLTLKDWVRDLIADAPLEKAMEAPVPGEDVE